MNLEAQTFADNAVNTPLNSALVHPKNLLKIGTGSQHVALDRKEGVILFLTSPTSNDGVKCEEVAGDVPRGDQKRSESSGSAIMEVRLLADLTWEELAEVFGANRHSIHSWASGKSLRAKEEQHVYHVLDEIRRIDRGTSRENRALLLREHNGVVPIALLRDHKYEEFVELVDDGPGRPKPKSLSKEAWEARRPPPVNVMLSALQDTVHIERRGPVSTTSLPSKPKK